MCLAPSAPAAPAMPAPPPPPPAPPAPPPAPMSVGEKVGTIKTAASMRSAKGKSAGAMALKAPTPSPISTITGQATGLNVPSAE